MFGRANLNHPPTAVADRPAGFVKDFAADPLQTFERLRMQYGDIVRLRYIGPLYGYLLYHPDHFKQVLVDNNRSYRKMPTPSFAVLEPLVGKGLLTSDGDLWLRQRRLAQPAFHRRRIDAFAATMTETTQQMLDGWQAQAGERTLDVHAALNSLTLSIVGRTLFSVDLEQESEEVGAAISEASAQTIKLTTHPLGMFLLRLPVYPTTRRLNQAVSVIDNLVNGIISRRRSSGDHDYGDLLSMFMLAEDEESGERMSDSQLRDEVQTMILAGHETTALLLTWALYLLAKHPPIYERLQQEIDETLAGKTATVADMRQLPYLEQVLNETLRLYPPAYAMARNCVAGDKIDGYDLPPNSLITMSITSLHHHPDFWPDAERFDPERFTPEQVAKRHRYAFLPFGAGPRQCIGNRFAMTEATLLLATLLQRMRFRLPPGYTATVEPMITLRPKRGMPLLVAPRT